MEKTIKTLLPIENEREEEEILSFLSELDAEEKREFLGFIRGAKFAKKFHPEKIA